MQSVENFEGYKFGIIIVGGLFFLATLIGLIICWINKDYKPIKAKQLPVLSGAFLSGFFWWFGSIHSLGVFEDVPAFWFANSCLFWNILIQIVFGLQLYLSIWAFRMLRLYFILVRAQKPQGIWFWWILTSLSAPCLTLSLLAPFFPNQLISSSPMEIGSRRICVFTYSFAAFVITMTVVQIVFLVILNWKMQMVRKSFNEFKEMQIALSIFVVSGSGQILCYLFKAQNSVAGKIFISYLNLIAILSLMWVTLARPLYGALFRREEYLREWRKGLLGEHLPTILRHGVKSTTELTMATTMDDSFGFGRGYEDFGRLTNMSKSSFSSFRRPAESVNNEYSDLENPSYPRIPNMPSQYNNYIARATKSKDSKPSIDDLNDTSKPIVLGFKKEFEEKQAELIDEDNDDSELSDSCQVMKQSSKEFDDSCKNSIEESRKSSITDSILKVSRKAESRKSSIPDSIIRISRNSESKESLSTRVRSVLSDSRRSLLSENGSRSGSVSISTPIPAITNDPTKKMSFMPILQESNE